MDEDHRRALDDLKAFEATFLQCREPGQNSQMLRQLTEILGRIGSSHSYLNEKKGKLQRAAELWFSKKGSNLAPPEQRMLRVEILGNIKSVMREIEPPAQ